MSSAQIQFKVWLVGHLRTYVTVNTAPFDLWMATPSPTASYQRWVTLDDGTTGISARIIEVTDLDAGHGYKTLVVEGRHAAPDANPPYAAPGKWYWIGEQTVELDACQTGEWDAAADQDSSGNFTEFTLPIEAYISDFQVGWLLQPDVNVAVYLPITSISGHTLTVSGSYGSLAPSSSGTHFRIHAPPEVERTGPFFSGFEAGTLSRFTSASSSRNLFGGYRYESPLAGVRDDLWMAVQGRQSGWNFTGLHYTLHRHYDPHLMRFTSIDPAAAPFFNLYAYCGGNPARAYDPDGLSALILADYLFNDGEATQAYWRDLGYVKGRVKQNFKRYEEKGLEEGLKQYGKDVGTASAGYVAGAADSISPYAGNWVAEQFQDMGVDTRGDLFGYGRVVGNVSASVMQMALTGGGCGWAKALSVGLTVSDFGHAGYALATGDITSAVSTLVGQTIGFGAGRLAKGHWICFVEGTQVAAEGDDGAIDSRSIEDIEVGDHVWSRNEFTGEEGFKEVVQVFRNEASTLAHVSYTSSTGLPAREQTVTGTPEHPFWSVTRNAWVNMGELRTGEALTLANGSTATVSSCRVEKLTTPVRVYNFEVADWHTYHVGSTAGWVWVHNRCGPKDAVAKLKAMRKQNRALGLVQDHHLIPYSGMANFQGHGLVQAANVNLQSYSRNLLAIGNHVGGHSRAYRDGVRDILDAQEKLFLQGGSKNAQQFLDDAIGQIEQGIKNGSLRPYTNKDVWTLR